MDQNIIKEAREKLEKTKSDLENELEKIAEKDKKTEGDWDAKFPQFDREESGSGALEKAADEVEEYNTRLSLEHNLELRLKDVNAALEKINLFVPNGINKFVPNGINKFVPNGINKFVPNGINKFVPNGIKSGSYGKCENCQKEINPERLAIYPEARMCSDCETGK